MSDNLNLQHNYLEKIKEEEIEITVYLKNGVQINGKLEDYDEYVISIRDNDELQMIMKKGITTIEPKRAIEDYFPDEF